MNNASTADGRGQDGPKDAEPFFPSEGTFNTVVPLSEVGRAPAPAPLLPVKAADVGRPAEAAWARAAHRAALKEEDETTLVPARSPGAPAVRRSWAATAAVIALSVVAGLASGAYLIRSSQPAPEAQPRAQVAAEAPSLPAAPAADAAPAPAAEEVTADAKAEGADEAAKVENSGEAAKVEKSGEAAKAERSAEVVRAPKQPASPAPAAAPRAERPARAAEAAREVAPAPKPAPSRRAAPAPTRVTTAERRPTAPPSSGRTLPVSSPPPSAKSRKVIQWP